MMVAGPIYESGNSVSTTLVTDQEEDTHPNTPETVIYVLPTLVTAISSPALSGHSKAPEVEVEAHY